MGRKASLAVFCLGTSCFVGCGGGGGSSTPPPPSPTITSVSVTCASSSVQTGQTSQCSATVSGTGSYNSSVTWSATSGTISSSGLYTAPATVPASGSDTIKAVSTEDPTHHGTAPVTVTAAPAITSVSVLCNAPSVQTGQTSQCSATVTGTGNFNSSVNWSVNGISNGNATSGTIGATGLYLAPTILPNPYTVTITATSAVDTTQSASVPMVVGGTIASVSQNINAASGGTITLPDGSNVVIPANALPIDENVTLSELSLLPQQAPNQFIVGVGTTLELTFSVPVPLVPESVKMEIPGRNAKMPSPSASGSSPSLSFTVNQQQVSPGLTGAIGLVEVNDTTNVTSAGSTAYSAAAQTSLFSVPASWITGFKNGVVSIAISASNTAYTVFDFLPSIDLPISKCWQPSVSTWTDFSNCQSQVANKRVLVVVHGMMSCVESTYQSLPTLMNDMSAISPQNSKPYDLILGFDYDWTQHLTDSAALLEAFLEQIAALQPSGIDIVAHSEGVPVSLYAASQTPDRSAIKNFFGLAGPVLGTPIALRSDLLADTAINLNYGHGAAYDTCPASSAFHQMGFAQILEQAPFIQDLQPNSPAIIQIVRAVQSNLGGTKILLAGGENPGVALGFIYSLGSPFGTTPNDGIVGLDSSLAYDAGFTVYPFSKFPNQLFHTDLPGDSGILSAIANQAIKNQSPQLTCTGSSGRCEGPQNTQFDFTGTGFGSSETSIQLYSQDSTGTVTPLQTPGLADSGGSMNWTMPADTQPTGQFSIFAFDNALTLASNNVMQTVGIAAPPITISISPPSVSLFFGGTQSFTAPVMGTTNTAVSWSILEGSAGGAITSGGLYTAPAIASTYHVIATSQADSAATATATVTVTSPANNPVPTISALAPSSVQVGAPSQTLTINGTGYLATSTVIFDGIARATNYVSPTQLTVSLTATDLAAAGVYPVVVMNPAPGGGSSGTGNFTVINPQNANEWTWMSGSNLANGAPVYGTKNVASSANIPGARGSAVSWIDGGGNLWLFGGWGVDYSGDFWGNLNDLWIFNPSSNFWTWVSGSNSANVAGVYGVQGVASVSNVPGARSGAVSWIDASGNLWLFGGSTGVVTMSNDLWEFNPTNMTWEWVSGADEGSQSGTYGTVGVPSTANAPGARTNAVSWIDSGGNLWLFGGQGYDSTGTGGYLNDLWEFNPTSKTWTWVSGSSTLELFADGLRGEPGVYGTQGIPNGANVPCGRLSANSWIDSSGNLWLFGGYGQATPTSGTGVLNDQWEFNPTNKQWTWVGGSDTPDQPGVYGTLGVASPINFPGSRQEALSWKDASGDLWLSGGIGHDSVGYYQYLNDLWKFDPSSKTWTWKSGSNQAGATGVYGVLGVADATNVPGQRDQTAGWIDGSGDLWLFGGYGSDSVGGGGYLNDLWRYQP